MADRSDEGMPPAPRSLSGRKRTKSAALLEAERDAIDHARAAAASPATPAETDDTDSAAVAAAAAAPAKRKRVASAKLRDRDAAEDDDDDDEAAAQTPPRSHSKSAKKPKSAAKRRASLDDSSHASDHSRIKDEGDEGDGNGWGGEEGEGDDGEGGGESGPGAAAAASADDASSSEEDDDNDLLSHLPPLSTSLRSKTLPNHCVVLVVFLSVLEQRREYWVLPYAALTQHSIRTLMALNGMGCNDEERRGELSALWGQMHEQLGWTQTTQAGNAAAGTHALTAAAAAAAALQSDADSHAARPVVKSEHGFHPSAAATSPSIKSEFDAAAAASSSTLASDPPPVWMGAHGWQRLACLHFDPSNPARRQQAPIPVNQHVAMMFHIAFP